MQAEYAFLDAVSFAARSHDGQRRKDNATPYAAHVFRVCLIVRQLFKVEDPAVLAAAVLHDTIEDTKTDFDDLAERYGPRIAGWVALLSKDKRKEEHEREEAYLAGLAAAPWQVKACKLADLVDNMLDMESLPAAKRETSKKRYRGYWAAFRKWTEPELQPILRIVQPIADSATS
ncbi:MAG: HD domain-containing protein [Gemmataceae bacterium]